MPEHHLDRRAADIAAACDGAPDDLIDSKALAEWLGVAPSWPEVARCKGYGPPFVKLGPRNVRYRRDSVLAWLKERERQRTEPERRTRRRLSTPEGR